MLVTLSQLSLFFGLAVDGGEAPPHHPPEGDVLLLLLLRLVDAGLPRHHRDGGIYETGSWVLMGATLGFCDWSIYSRGLVQLLQNTTYYTFPFT